MKRHGHILLLALLALAVIFFAFLAADAISQNDSAKEIVEQFGVLGIIVISFIAGLNLFVPVHAATFTPIFLEVGFPIVIIISAMVVGTTVADLLSYFLGRWGKNRTHTKYQKFFDWLYTFKENHYKLILPGIFVYSALVPLPNEIILIPPVSGG